MSGACYATNWNNGPKSTGGNPDGYLCELDAGHEGDHGWDIVTNVKARTTWPAKKHFAPRCSIPGCTSILTITDSGDVCRECRFDRQHIR